MFFVFNKRKINSYLISIGTVITLFAVSMFTNRGMENTVATSATNIINSQSNIESQKMDKNVQMNNEKAQTKNVENNIESITNSINKK